MAAKLITLESDAGPHQMMLQRIMRMVPEKDRNDVALMRLLAFRLRIDGEGATREFLISRIRDMIQSTYSGPLYDWLKADPFVTGLAARDDHF